MAGPGRSSPSAAAAGARFGLGAAIRPLAGAGGDALEDGVDLRVATDYRDAFRQVVAELAPGAPVPFGRG